MLKCFSSQAPFKDIYKMVEATSLQVTQSKKGGKSTGNEELFAHGYDRTSICSDKRMQTNKQ